MERSSSQEATPKKSIETTSKGHYVETRQKHATTNFHDINGDGEYLL